MDGPDGEPPGKKNKSGKNSSDHPEPAELDQWASSIEGPGPYDFEAVKMEPGWKLEQSIDKNSTDWEPAGNKSHLKDSCDVKSELETPDQFESTPEELCDLEMVKNEPGWEGGGLIDMCSTDGEPAGKRSHPKYSCDVKSEPETPDQFESTPEELCDLAVVKNEPGKEVRNVWKNLRQEFGKQWRKCSHSGEAAPDEIVCNWPFFAALEFLADQFKPRVKTGNLEIHQDCTSQIASENLSEDEFHPPPSDPPLPTSASSSSGFRLRKTPQTVVGEALISIEREKLDMKRARLTEPEDDNMLFLKSLAPQMRKLDPQLNMLFRTEMQGRLYNLLYKISRTSAT